MSKPNNDKNLILFRSLFKGREDVFALRWEKGAKSGYMPAYLYDPYRYKAHKMKGGTFQTYTDKTYLPFTDDQLVKHLNGEQLIGIYPLLKDNTSWFIAADFDKQSWVADSRKFLEICKTKDIPVYLERSRSGNGGHAWIFFNHPYPAIKSRKIILSLNQAFAMGVYSGYADKELLSDFGIGKIFGDELQHFFLAANGNSLTATLNSSKTW